MKSISYQYVHGHTDKESDRLSYQAPKFAGLLHHDTRYSAGSRVLEVACGIGAQTTILVRNNPGADFVSIDISAESLVQAKQRISRDGIAGVSFCLADIHDLPFEPGSFDHVFVCFLLEHLPDPVRALTILKEILKPNGTITVIEGDYGSVLFYPDGADAHRILNGLIELQRQMGGNALIGRELRHLMRTAGFRNVTVSPRPVYSDNSHLDHAEEVTNIFISMVEGLRESAITRGLVDNETWENGIRDLYRTTDNDGVLCYTFFKAVGIK